MNFNFSSKKDLVTFLNVERFKKIFVLTGNISYKLSGIGEILDKYLISKKNKSFSTKFYFKKSPIPIYEELKDIISEINKFKPDLIISAGGGSVIDYAKIANVLFNENDLSNKIINSSYLLKRKLAKLCAIPTTAGSGAEVTSNAVIYLNKIKYSIEGNYLLPDYFFLLPEIVVKVPKKLKACSGFDAISQSIESLISKKSNSESLDFAKKSLSISLKYFIDYLNKPNEENSSAMCFAANLSGKAINISKTTAPHALSYPFTSIFGINHGHAVSLTLNDFLNFNYKNISQANCDFDLKKRFEIIFKLTKSKNINDLDKFIINLKLNSKLESNFKKLGINIENDYSKIISGVNSQRLQNNPIKLTEIDIKNILLKNHN